MPLTLTAATAQDVAQVVHALGEQELLLRYQLTGPQLLALLVRGLDAGDIFAVARLNEAHHAACDGAHPAAGGGAGPSAPSTPLISAAPCGFAWGMARGAFGSGGYLRLLMVADHARGMGVGRALVAEFEARCQGPRGGYFAMTEATDGAAPFYQALGYAALGSLPGFVRPARTEMLLWKAP